MGYLTNSCRYCNGDNDKCFCRCHTPDPEQRDRRCDPEEFD